MLIQASKRYAKIKKAIKQYENSSTHKVLKELPVLDKLPVRGVPRKNLKSAAGKVSALPAPKGRRAVSEEDSNEEERPAARLVEDTNSGVEKVCKNKKSY